MLQNASIEENSEEMSELIKVAHESIIIFSDIFTGRLDPTELSEVENWLTRSEAVLRSHDSENITEEPIIERVSCDFPLTREWMSNGVWNVSCMEHFKSKISLLYRVRLNHGV